MLDVGEPDPSKRSYGSPSKDTFLWDLEKIYEGMKKYEGIMKDIREKYVGNIKIRTFSIYGPLDFLLTLGGG